MLIVDEGWAEEARLAVIATLWAWIVPWSLAAWFAPLWLWRGRRCCLLLRRERGAWLGVRWQTEAHSCRGRSVSSVSVGFLSVALVLTVCWGEVWPVKETTQHE